MRRNRAATERPAVLGLVLGLLLVLGLAGPAAAGHKASHGGTDSAVSEDNDGDQVRNNLPDEGDNEHPSGKDRSIEHGGSGDQGRTRATPDQDGKGPERDTHGTDQPDGAGGGDIIDQDRNNGCGNDDDFDDDSEGHCRRRTAPSASETVTAPLPPTEVLGAVIPRPGAQVLGITVTREAAAVGGAVAARQGVLASTGTHGLPALLLLGLTLLLAGATLLVARRRVARGPQI